MNLLVVGTIGLDTVKTPFGRAEGVLGGSATYFAITASHFCHVRISAVVGDDFPREYMELLKSRNIDLTGLEIVKGGATFRWEGEYHYDLNEAITIATHLNVIEDFKPELPPSYRSSDLLFLANIDPDIQLAVLDQMENPRLVAMDTMNFWIENKPEALKKVMSRVEMMIINEAEARQLTGQHSLIKAAQKILEAGPKILVIKQGSYGSIMFSREGIFSAPAFPLDDVFDPTGAGDSFAGGFMGYMAMRGETDDATMRQAVIVGSVMASYNCEGFSLDKLCRLTYEQIEERYKKITDLTRFDGECLLRP